MGSGNQKRILLVEDEALIALAQKKTLENHGYAVVTASSGEKAVILAGTEPDIDLILMDINLGDGIDGTEAAARILENHDIPLVFLSSHTEREVVEKTEGITSYGYIVKNSGEMVLAASVKMAFKLFDAHRRIQAQRMDIEAAYEEMQVSNEELMQTQQDLLEHEAALKLSEERYRMAQKVGHVGNWEYNVKTTRFWGSDEARRIFGFEPDAVDFTTEEVERRIPERERVHQALVDLIQEGKEYNIDYTIQPHGPGDSRIIWSVAELQRDAEGNPLIVTGVIHDISERKEAERKIQEQLHELQRWYDATLDREDRILELKREVNGLLSAGGKAPKYKSVMEEPHA
jgi:PAS domain S-box-containing protein